MSAVHIRYEHDQHGTIPLCGRAMWEYLVDEADARHDPDVCWECASIVGFTPARFEEL